MDTHFHSYFSLIFISPSLLLLLPQQPQRNTVFNSSSTVPHEAGMSDVAPKTMLPLVEFFEDPQHAMKSPETTCSGNGCHRRKWRSCSYWWHWQWTTRGVSGGIIEIPIRHDGVNAVREVEDVINRENLVKLLVTMLLSRRGVRAAALVVWGDNRGGGGVEVKCLEKKFIVS